MQLAMDIQYKSSMAFEIIIISADIIGLMTIHSTHKCILRVQISHLTAYKMEYGIG